MPRIPFDESLRSRIRAHLDAFDRRPNASPALTRAAVCLVVLGGTDGEASFVLTRRPASLKRHGGQWALPGGRCDDGERAPEAALREAREEVGLTLEPEDVLGTLDDHPTRSGFVITPVVVWGPEQPRLSPDPNEVASAHIVPFHVLDAPGAIRFTHNASGKRLVSLELSRLQTVVWAPTAAMVYQCREVAIYGRPTRTAHFEHPRFAWR